MSSKKGKAECSEPVPPKQPDEPECIPPPEPIVCPPKEEKPKEQCPTPPKEEKKEKDTCPPPAKDSKQASEDKGKKEDHCQAPKEEKKENQNQSQDCGKKEKTNNSGPMQNFHAQSCQPSIIVQCPNKEQQDQHAQQKENPNPPGVCKKEQAIMALMEEQAKPPPLTINVKVGVPAKACEDDGSKEDKKERSKGSCSPPRDAGKKGDKKKSC